MSTRLPLELSETLKAFIDFEIIPNVFEYIMDESEFIG